MKKLGILLASLFVMTLATQHVKAQTSSASASANASAFATIIQPLTIEKTGDLNFGNIVAGTGTGTVNVDLVGRRTSTGNVILPSATPGTVSPAKFTVSGLTGATYAITLPTSATLTLSGGEETMTINNFKSNPKKTGELTDGSQEISVSATLNVGADQAPGEYSGEFAVTVAYN